MQKFRVGQNIKFRRSNMEVCNAVIIDRRLSTNELRITYLVNGKEIGNEMDSHKPLIEKMEKNV